ncbi:MAG: CPBP family intramembrane metalloprotease [Chloroflexi bacterium]|nr:CPBP family intramembrane metalloprotease [Chloroflexota bacterium]
MNDTEFVVRLVGIVIAVLVYYGLVVKHVGDWLAHLLLERVNDHLALARRYSVDELDSMIRLVLAGMMQLMFCVALIAISGMSAGTLLRDSFQPILLVYGVLLGVGEAALGSFLGHIGMRTAMLVAPNHVPSQIGEWLVASKGGWMRLYLRTAEAAPAPLVLLSTVLYVSVEEIVFRGVLLSFSAGVGAVVACTLSVALFVLVQIFHMPSWQSAMFPVLGALLVGLVHAPLYLVVPNLLPLIVAHAVLFLMAIL